LNERKSRRAEQFYVTVVTGEARIEKKAVAKRVSP
jgi:hypothetical protein